MEVSIDGWMDGWIRSLAEQEKRETERETRQKEKDTEREKRQTEGYGYGGCELLQAVGRQKLPAGGEDDEGDEGDSDRDREVEDEVGV